MTREKIKYKYLSYASHLPLDIFKDKNSNIFIGNIVIDLNLTRRILKASPRCFFLFVDRLHASSFAPSSPPHSFPTTPYSLPTTPPLFRVSLRLLSLFPRCPRTSSPPHSPVTRAQPITTWAETMGSGDKPGASQSNPFDRVETLLELPRPPFQPLKCIVTFHPEIK